MPPENRAFPHLLAPDIAVWRRFLKHHSNDYYRIDYDVKVGIGRDPGDTHEANIRQMAIDLSRRRIDAIGYTTERIDIIEITTAAGLTAIGQLTAYVTLYQQQFHPTIPLRPLLVCSSLQTDIEPALVAAGIDWFTFPEPATPQAPATNQQQPGG